MDDQTFLRDIQNADADIRFAAWRQAGTVTAAVIPQLGKLAADDKGIGKAAREALTTMTHSFGKIPTAPNREAVVKGLLDLTNGNYDLGVKVHAIRLLGNIAGADSVPAIAKHFQDAALAEEVVFALERIPGQPSINAIVAAYPAAKDDFKPRLLAALGHLRAPEGVALSITAMRSTNKDIAIGGMRAFGRIGQKPATAPAYADTTGMTGTQKADYDDSILRYADSQASAGNVVEAIGIYKTFLQRSEVQLQCAALIGLAKTGTPEAAQAIFPLIRNANSRVRITAQKAWQSMADVKA